MTFRDHADNPGGFTRLIFDPIALVDLDVATHIGSRAVEQRAAAVGREGHHYSITWSARASIDGGIVRPSALAVLRLITSSSLMGCSTGMSAGLAPLRILST
jgi:hypothetical protein